MAANVGISDTHATDALDRAEYRPGLSTKHLRVEFHWDFIETSPGVFNWAPYDAIVNWATANGVKILGIANRCPQWAFNAFFNIYYKNFAAALVARYPSVIAWEPFNEPNATNGYFGWPYWNVDPGDLNLAAQRYANAVKAFRQGAPNAFIVMGAMTMDGYSPINWLPVVLANVAPTDYDAISLHRYGPGVNLLQDQANVQALCGQAGHPTNRKLWITERGEPTVSSMATVMDQTFTAANVNGLGAIYWFAERDNQATGETHGVVKFNRTKRTTQYNKLKGYLQTYSV